MKLSRDFDHGELFVSQRFPRLVADPITLPWKAHIMLGRLVHEALQPIREALASPVVITSGFRSPELNESVGGSLLSRHMCSVGSEWYAAADFYCLDVPADTVFKLLAMGQTHARFDRVCLYPGKGRLHIDVRDWALGPPSHQFYVDRGSGWGRVSPSRIARQ